jgi:hypothetical protein
VKNTGPLSVFFFPEFLSRKKIEKFLESFSCVSLTNYANFLGDIRQIFNINKLEKKTLVFYQAAFCCAQAKRMVSNLCIIMTIISNGQKTRTTSCQIIYPPL